MSHSPRSLVALSFALAALALAGACGDDDDDDGMEPVAGSAASGAGAGSGGHDGGPHGPAADGGPNLPAPAVCDVTPPTRCAEPAPTYTDDVGPIIAKRCLGCHDGKGEQWPLTSESHVASWFSQIRDVMIRCQMPPADSGITMPNEERETILAWLRCKF